MYGLQTPPHWDGVGIAKEVGVDPDTTTTISWPCFRESTSYDRSASRERAMPIGIDDLATNLIASAMFEVVRHPLRKFREFGARRAEIIRAAENQLTGSKARAATTTLAAFDDLVGVLGNEYGIYTEKVDTFITELQSSALPSSLFRLIICGEDVESAKPLFDSLYATFSPLPFPSEKLFRALCGALSARIEAAVSDPILIDVMRATSESVRHDIARLQSSLARTNEIQSLANKEFVEIRMKIARMVDSENRDIPVETERGTRRVAISRLVIPARVTLSDAQSIKKGSSNEPSLSLSLNEFKSSAKASVILGDPGGGKSTLTQYLCYTMSKRIISGFSPNSSIETDGDNRLPLRIIVRTLDHRQRNSAGYSILDYLVDQYRVATDNDIGTLRRFLVQVLSTGKALLLFDGLDEVLEVGRRREIAADIERFVTVFSTCPALITSRIVGYDDAPFNDDFDLYLLSRLSNGEIQRFCEKLLRVIGGCVEDPKVMSAKFMAQTEPHAKDLRQNPLLLGLMVYIFKEKGDVPDNRPEIYKACSQLLFLKWDQRRDILFSYPDDFELMDLFGFLAVKVFGDVEMEDGVSEDWLLGQVKSFFNEWYNDRARATAAARSLVQFITGRAWVMTDVGPGVYKFTHRTFMEYFVARRFESESDSVTNLFQVLYPKIIKAEWDVVGHLSLQIAASNGPKATKAIDAILESMRIVKRNPVEEYNLLEFVSRSLGYLSISETKFEEVLNEVMNRCFEVSSKTSIDTYPVVRGLPLCSAKKEELATDVVVQFIRRELASNDKARQRFARLCLASRQSVAQSTARSRRSLETDRFAILAKKLLPTRKEAQSEILIDATKDVDAARIYCMVYGYELPVLWNIHGSDLIVFSTSELCPKEYTEAPYTTIYRILNDIDEGKAVSEGVVSFLSSVSEHALESGISINQPVLRTEQGAYVSFEVAEEAFRRFYFIFSLGDRSRKNGGRIIPDKTKRVAAMAMIVLLMLVEVEQAVSGSSYHQKVRYLDENYDKFVRSKLIAVYMPPDLFLKTVNLMGSSTEQEAILDWANGRINFVSSAL